MLAVRKSKKRLNDAPFAVLFPKGDPSRAATVEITGGEFAFVVPYDDDEAKIDRRSGLVLNPQQPAYPGRERHVYAGQGQPEETP
jgi:hypothetical protein